MTDRTKKYLQKLPSDVLHIGNLIAWFIQEKHLKKASIAQQLKISPTTMSQYFKQPSVQVGILWRLSQAMEYNLFAYIGDRLQIPFETQREKALLEQLNAQNEQIKEMKIQLEVYKEMTRRG